MRRCAGFLVRVGRGLDCAAGAESLAPPVGCAGAGCAGAGCAGVGCAGAGAKPSAAKDFGRRAPVAPACGLWLEEVFFGGAEQLPGTLLGTQRAGAGAGAGAEAGAGAGAAPAATSKTLAIIHFGADCCVRQVVR